MSNLANISFIDLHGRYTPHYSTFMIQTHKLNYQSASNFFLKKIFINKIRISKAA